MNHEIERKFFVKEMPDLSGIQAVRSERHFLFMKDGIELRITATSSGHFLQRKASLSDMSRETETMTISEAEFAKLKALSIGELTRDNYRLPGSQKTDIKVYGGQFKGLIRVEFEFASEDEASAFTPPAWVGKEITGTALARDKELLKLTPDEFKHLLNS